MLNFFSKQLLIEKGWKIGIVVGIILIIGTASLMALPFESESKRPNPVTTTFEEMEKSEEDLLDFIEQEKAELSTKMSPFSYP